jgi:DNA-directed RNA polymerase specialized sigma subunit
MSNEQLIRQYYDGDEAALEKLYHKNIGLIRGIAKETAAEFNCLMTDSHHPNQCSAYTKTILDDLCGEGTLEFLARIQSREYDQNCAALTTYLYPHLKGRMTRWLEQNIGCMALSKDEMAAVRQTQRLYHVAWKDTSEIAEELGIPEARVSRYVHYNTHFLGVHDLVPVGYDGDPYERLMPGTLSASAEQAVYRKVCIELLRELFDTLPKKDRDILGKTCGVFGYSEASLKEIGMYHMMKESAVEKAKNRAVEKLREAYPGSRLQVWRAVHRMMQRPIPLPENNVGLARHNSTEKEEQLLFIRRNFPIRPKYKNENLTWLMSRKELQ